MNKILARLAALAVVALVPVVADASPADASRVNARLKIEAVWYTYSGRPPGRHPGATGILTARLSNDEIVRYYSRDCARYDRLCQAAWRKYDRQRAHTSR